MRCADCKTFKCCRGFFFFYTQDGENIMSEIPFPFDYFTVVVPSETRLERNLCVLQLADGKCLIHKNKPRICDNYRC